MIEVQNRLQPNVGTLDLKSLELCKLYLGFIRKKQSSYIWKKRTLLKARMLLTLNFILSNSTNFYLLLHGRKVITSMSSNKG